MSYSQHKIYPYMYSQIPQASGWPECIESGQIVDSGREMWRWNDNFESSQRQLRHLFHILQRSVLQSTDKKTVLTAQQGSVLAGLKGGWKMGIKSMTIAARELDVPYHTLRRRCRGEVDPTHKAHKNQLRLSPAEEATLLEWFKYLGLIGHSVNKCTTRPKVNLRSKACTFEIMDWAASWFETQISS